MSCMCGRVVGQADNDGAQHIGIDLKERLSMKEPSAYNIKLCVCACERMVIILIVL